MTKVDYSKISEYVCMTCDRATYIYKGMPNPARCSSCGCSTVVYNDTRSIDRLDHSAGSAAEHHALTGQYRFFDN